MCRIGTESRGRSLVARLVRAYAARVDLTLLPGLDGTGCLFEPLLHMLPAGIRASVVSYPGDRRLGYSELLEIVAEHVPTRPYVLLGESFSGPLALLHAAKRPAGLQALVLVASFARSPAPAGAATLGSVLGGTRLAASRLVIRLLLSGVDAPGSLVAEVCSAVRSVRPAVLRHRLREVFAVDVRPCLADVQVPVLYLLARRDRLVGRRGLRSLGTSLRELRVHELDGPHLLLQRRPAQASQAIVTFMGEISARGGTAPSPGCTSP